MGKMTEPCKEEHTDLKVAGGAAGGAMFGFSVGGPPGALLGGIVGGLISSEVNAETKAVNRDWHEQFKRWAKPPSDTEEQKGSNAAGMIRDAIRKDSKLANCNISVYATGSYRNNTNVRGGSDIDVAVVLHDSFYYSLPDGLTQEMLGFTGGASYSFDEFRDDVGRALYNKFGSGGVTPGNKAFNIHENTYRLDADVTAFLIHKQYTGQRYTDGSWQYNEGVELRPRNNSSQRVINWHQQHYDAGVEKNNRTNRRYKRIARILKNLMYEMMKSNASKAKSAAEPVPSFLLECLAFNAPDDCFNLVDGSYYEDVKAVVRWLWNKTKPDTNHEFVEVSGLKALFSDSQAWTMEEAHEYLYQAWRYVGFGND